MNDVVIRTLAYHAIFDFPLSQNEIHKFLISDELTEIETIEGKLQTLVRKRKINQHGDFFALSHDVFQLRERRRIISKKKIKIAHRAACLIGKLPWIKLVAITGALAMENADEGDDVDLMVVSAKDRLWIIRPMVMFLISLFFKRRRPNLPNLTNALCLNLWIDESSLQVLPPQRNLYTAHELAQMKPIINKDEIYERMMEENTWGEKYLANSWSRLKGQQVERLTKPHTHFYPFNLLNFLAFSLQLWYMRPKMTTERVSLHSAFFHPGNRTATILAAYDRLCHRHL